MKRIPLLVLLALVTLAASSGCSTSDGCGDRWGGYTECDAKDVLKDPNVKREILRNAPGDPTSNPINQLYPSNDEIDDADMRKVTVQGQEAWEHRHPDENFCLYVWEDEATQNFATQVGVCAAD
jgi:hypothetical protein